MSDGGARSPPEGGEADVLSLARFFARAPVSAWLTDAAGRTWLLGRDDGRGAGRVPMEALFDGAVVERYRALNARVIREAVPLVTTEEGRAASAEEVAVYQVARFPVTMADGSCEAGGIAIEITDRVRVEQQLARSEARLRAMLEATNDGVWAIGPDSRTTWTNAAVGALLGYSETELAELSPMDLIHPEDRAGIVSEGAARPAGESGTRELRMRAKDGREVWVLHSSAPILDLQGGHLGAIAIFKDITLRKIEEERARRDAVRAQEAQRLEVLARLAGGIAHDFNNLLTAVLTGADMLSVEIGDRIEGAEETVDTIRRAGRRAAVLCRQLLALSGRSRFSMAPVDVAQAVTDAVRALRPSLDARHVLEVSEGPRVSRVVADDAQLQLLVTNLILNASEAIGARAGRIEVRVEQAEVDAATLGQAHVVSDLVPGPAVCLVVSDDGPGIAETVRSRLFEPFVTTRTAGRGLGLPAALGIVRGHGGAIRVRSRAGEGTAVEVFLPVAPATTALRSVAPASTVGGEGRLVLVIDDEPMVRAAACRVLRARGFSTLDAPDGAAGVELFRANQDRVSVVLLDLSMPEIDGVETLLRIRSVRPGTPAVIMSGYSEDEAAARFLGIGLASFLAKPFTPDELVRKLRAAIVPAS